MRHWLMLLSALLLGLVGCNRQVERHGGSGATKGLADGSAAEVAASPAGRADLAVSVADLAVAGQGASHRLAAADAGTSPATGEHPSDGGATEEESPSAGQVLKESSVTADFLVIELGDGDAVKKLSAIAGAQASVLCEGAGQTGTGDAPRECTSRLQIKSAPDSDAVLVSHDSDVPGITCHGEGESSCFEGEDVAVSLLALPGLPGGLIVVSGVESTDKVWQRDKETESSLFVLVRRGTLAPLELRKILHFSSASFHETTREDHPDMSRREREREPTRTEDSERTELSVVKKGKRSLPDLMATSTTDGVIQYETKPEKRRSDKRRTRFVFDGIGYVSADTALNTAVHCGTITKHCAVGEGCCGGECKPLSTTGNCGTCGHVCPGGSTTFSEARCQDVSKGVCSFGCVGSHYDIDGNEGNGCEQSDTTSDETDLGAQSCWDKPLRWNGLLLGDLREHRNPSLARLDAKTGSVPKVAKLTAQGGLLCQNDFSLRIKTEGSAKEACYRLHIEGLATPQVLTLKGTDEQTLSLSRGAYVSGRSLALRLEKICPGALALPFSVELHL